MAALESTVVKLDSQATANAPTVQSTAFEPRIRQMNDRCVFISDVESPDSLSKLCEYAAGSRACTIRNDRERNQCHPNANLSVAFDDPI